MERPKALLDGASEPARLVAPDSYAERAFDEGRVYEKVADFMGFIAILQNPDVPRLPGVTRVIRVANHPMLAIQGEEVPDGEPEPQYAFALGPDSGEFIEINRVVDGQGTVLSWADIRDVDNPIFRTSVLGGVIHDEAKVSELTQILAVGEDAAEWALD